MDSRGKRAPRIPRGALRIQTSRVVVSKDGLPPPCSPPWLVLAGLATTVLQIRRCVVAGTLVLAVLLSLLAAAIDRYGYLAPFTVVAGPTASALAHSAPPR